MLFVNINIRKKDYSDTPYLKWHHTQKNDKSQWLKFTNDLLDYIIGRPLGKRGKQDPRKIAVSDTSVSFSFMDSRYLFEIDKNNEQANLYIKIKGIKNLDNKTAIFKIKRESYYYKLYIPRSRNIDYFIDNLGSRFKIFLRKLNFQLGISILQLFTKPSELVTAYYEYVNEKNILESDLTFLASDKKIRQLVNYVGNTIKLHHLEFARCCK